MEKNLNSFDIDLNRVKVFLPERSKPLFAIPNLKIPAGQKVLIHGPSGLGKTTLLHLLAGLFLADEGEVQVGDFEWGAMSDSDRCVARRKHFGVVFQRLNLLEHLTVEENVELATKDPKQIAISLQHVGLSELKARRASLLSLGEQQRVAVARVLASKPSIILADEPTSSLDQANATAVMNALFAASQQGTLIVVSHDERIRSRFDQVLPLESFCQ